jgi:transposase-like protein
MYAILTEKPLLNRPVCTDCNAYMRVVRGNPFTNGTEEEHVLYACTECDRTLEHIVYPFGGRVAFHVAASPLTVDGHDVPECE